MCVADHTAIPLARATRSRLESLDAPTRGSQLRSTIREPKVPALTMPEAEGRPSALRVGSSVHDQIRVSYAGLEEIGGYAREYR